MGIFKDSIKKLLLISVLLFSTSGAFAKTVVLVHGFMTDGMYWRNSGFTVPLPRAGYTDGGSYTFSPWGMMIPRPIGKPANVFYTVNLPSETNLQTQEAIIAQYLNHIYTQRQEPITLLGHSAGGLVSRLYLLDPYRVPINGLITIATPHLGTPAANIAYLAGNSPIGMMASMVGGDTLQDARGLFSDLKEEKPGNFLYWLNHQRHPDIFYASVIRKNATISRPNKFDYVVPPMSQDMNNVWALKGKSAVALSDDSHSINGKDGLIALDILQRIP